MALKGHVWNARLGLVMRSLILLTSGAALFSTHCALGSTAAVGSPQKRSNAVVVVEPYAPNIVRVTLSLDAEAAAAKAGIGILASPNQQGWQLQQDERGDTTSSSRLKVFLAAERKQTGPKAETSRYFGGSTPWVGLRITTAEGVPLLSLNGWQMSVPNYKDGNAQILKERRPADDKFYQVGMSVASPSDEHYYGLGQNQEGYLDRRGHVVRCAHDYNAPSGQSVCVPFLVTNKGYGILWDNPSRTTVEFGFNDQVRWTSDVGQRVSFFLIAGKTYDEIYGGYRLLTGDTPIMPKSAYGYIQSKQRYKSQEELLHIASEYRRRGLPLDTLVIDWFHYEQMGDLNLRRDDWPDPTAMNRQLHAMNVDTMISIWPRFTPESRYYQTVFDHHWFQALDDGTPTNGLPYDKAGSDIDTTNPEAAAWYWDRVRENYLSKGFDAFWADETEPDLPPNGSYWKIGPGTEYFNVYPYFHTKNIYEGLRRDASHRALILSRDAYTGAQHNGAMFWSSDVSPNWDTLKRQVPTGINFVASGMPYWSTDIGGWQYLPGFHRPDRKPLLDPSDARAVVGRYDDYPELYARWFEYGSFQPVFRSHGSRTSNEVWSYGAQAEPVLTKYLRLRYQLMPYIYSLAYKINQTGAPQMRGLFMDFGADPMTANIGDEYMFGPSLLVAPVVEQGMTSRPVYLPAGSDWYDFWTNRKYKGGQTIQADAPIETIPLYVKAGSILPLGTEVQSTKDKQEIARLKVYPGANADFTLYDDDGTTYAYERGKSTVTTLHWDDRSRQLTHTGAERWHGPDAAIVEVVQ